MSYLAIPSTTAHWLIENKEYLAELGADFIDLIKQPSLKSGDFSIGPLHLSGSEGGELVALWNSDYSSGTGDDPWGFIKVAPPFGLLGQPGIVSEVLDRCVFIISMRLRGLLLPENCFHRPYENNIHTCMAARGDELRKWNLGYYEGEISTGHTSRKTVLIVGPDHAFSKLCATVAEEIPRVLQLNQIVEDVAAPARPRPVLNLPYLEGFKQRARGAIVRDRRQGIDVTYRIDASFGNEASERSYDAWVAAGGGLTPAQRDILESDAIFKSPIRIVGPAGSGKTLIIQLLAMRLLKQADESRPPRRVSLLYICHNKTMADNVWARFMTLGAEPFLVDQRLQVASLASYASSQLSLDNSAVIDVDAFETKKYQREIVRDCLRLALRRGPVPAAAKIMAAADSDPALFEVLATLVANEISTVIKGHGLSESRELYVSSERKLSRFHGAISQADREYVFDVFINYNHQVFEESELLDSDDMALSLLGRLRTPIWNLRRKSEGFDFVFVDETHLFNENERRIFPLLTKGSSAHVPIVLAMDEAQQIQGSTSAGFGLLGIQDLRNQKLTTVHRSTQSITRAAFFAIQRTTDLFTSDFPDFTGEVLEFISDAHPLARHPALIAAAPDFANVPDLVHALVQNQRKANIRQICIVIHADRYWSDVTAKFRKSDLPVLYLTQRGERIDPRKPLIVVARPDSVGGQEFDCVIAVGLEQGLVPPRVQNNEALASALEQQALREIYVSFTRARYRLIIAIADGAPTPVIAEAIAQGVVDKVATIDEINI